MLKLTPMESTLLYDGSAHQARGESLPQFWGGAGNPSFSPLVGAHGACPCPGRLLLSGGSGSGLPLPWATLGASVNICYRVSTLKAR